MNPCDKCPIDDKIFECCGRFPVTGETACISIDENRMIFACPHLDLSGKCRIYQNRPYPCQAYYCRRYDTAGKVGAGYQVLKDQWTDGWFEDEEM